MEKLCLAGAALFFSMNMYATDFSEADAKFAKRDVDLPATLAARSAYQNILEGTSKTSEKLRAAEGVLRTYIFEGTHYHSLNTEEGRMARKAVFADCWTQSTEAISPNNLGYESAVYYYFRSACLAYDAQVSTVDQQLELVPKLMDAIQKGLATEGGTNYEAGGLYRVAAAVKYNPAAKDLPGGLFNPEEALYLLDQAIAAVPFPETNIPGTLFCENFSHKVQANLVIGKYAEALLIASKSLDDFQGYLAEGTIPEFVRAETLDCTALLTALKTMLENPAGL